MEFTIMFSQNGKQLTVFNIFKQNVNRRYIVTGILLILIEIFLAWMDYFWYGIRIF